MKRLSTSLLVVGLAFAGTASAQSYGAYPDASRDGYGNRGYDDASGYDYARVVRVDPVIGYGGSRTASRNCSYRRSDEVYAGGNGAYRDGDGYYRSGGGYDRDGYYGRDDDYRRNGGGEGGRTMATVLGTIAGAVLGSKMGDGSGRYVGTAVGSMVGGMAGRSIYDSAQRNRRAQSGTVRVCDPVPTNGRGDYYGSDERVDGYDVTYEYAGRTYHTRTAYHPGDRIRVRVSAAPE